MDSMLEEIKKRAGIVGQQVQQLDPRQKALQLLQQAGSVPVDFLKNQAPIGALLKGDFQEAGQRIFQNPALAGFKSNATSQQQIDAALNLTPMGVTKVAPLVKATPAFKGFDDITTKVLNMLKGKAETSKQEIQNFTNQPQLKQAERDLIRRKLEGQGAKVEVSKFAQSVKDELLPITLDRPPGSPAKRTAYEEYVLSDELRGPVANYDEHIWSSPIKTSAGNVHYGAEPNYFAHTRVEDLPGETSIISKGIKIPGSAMLRNPSGGDVMGVPGTTRRVLEIQSDLFQKGNLDKEKIDLPNKQLTNLQQLRNNGWSENQITNYQNDIKHRDAAIFNRDAELSKLKPYENIWHERVIREEVKKAAQDGKTVLQFPTGETAMKIEKLGDSRRFYTADSHQRPITADKLQIGDQITPQGGGNHFENSDIWVVTGPVNEGKFRVISKSAYDRALNTGFKGDSLMKYINNQLDTEVFDISGKVDTENPIYKFYDKEVSRYLTNKYQAKRITDPQGVEWMQVDVKPEQGRLPIEAFGMLPFMNNQDNEKANQNLPIYMR